MPYLSWVTVLTDLSLFGFTVTISPAFSAVISTFELALAFVESVIGKVNFSPLTLSITISFELTEIMVQELGWIAPLLALGDS